MTAVAEPIERKAGGRSHALPVPPAPSATPFVGRGPLGEQLVAAGLIERAQLDTALSRQSESGQRLGETLLELGFVSEEQLLPFIEGQLGVSAVRLREGLLDPQAVRLLPRQFAERLGVIALFKVR